MRSGDLVGDGFGGFAVHVELAASGRGAQTKEVVGRLDCATHLLQVDSAASLHSEPIPSGAAKKLQAAARAHNQDGLAGLTERFVRRSPRHRGTIGVGKHPGGRPDGDGHEQAG
jgi:hypothetical protein